MIGPVRQKYPDVPVCCRLHSTRRHQVDRGQWPGWIWRSSARPRPPKLPSELNDLCRWFPTPTYELALGTAGSKHPLSRLSELHKDDSTGLASSALMPSHHPEKWWTICSRAPAWSCNVSKIEDGAQTPLRRSKMPCPVWSGSGLPAGGLGSSGSWATGSLQRLPCRLAGCGVSWKLITHQPAIAPGPLKLPPRSAALSSPARIAPYASQPSLQPAPKCWLQRRPRAQRFRTDPFGG